VDLAALAADLASLTRALGRPGIDLEAETRTLTLDLARAVESYVGLRITMAFDAHEISCSAYADGASGAEIATSLRLPLPPLAPVGAGSRLVLYAATPGAFVDLAADLTYALALESTSLALDQDVRPPMGGGIDGLRSLSDINQAIGLLVGRGHTIPSARAELRRLAQLDSGDLHHVAAGLLVTVRPPGDDRF
jgi:hypothetical protein